MQQNTEQYWFYSKITPNIKPNLQEWLENNHVNVLDWLSQCPDLSPVQNLCQDLIIAFNAFQHVMNEVTVKEGNN